jgi:hypothetical protein
VQRSQGNYESSAQQAVHNRQRGIGKFPVPQVLTVHDHQISFSFTVRPWQCYCTERTGIPNTEFGLVAAVKPPAADGTTSPIVAGIAEMPKPAAS